MSKVVAERIEEIIKTQPYSKLEILDIVAKVCELSRASLINPATILCYTGKKAQIPPC